MKRAETSGAGRLEVAERAGFLKKRMEMVRQMRRFFESRGYWEVETPYLVPAPGEEIHLRCFSSVLESPSGAKRKLFLHTSPEFAMKRLLAGLNRPIFQLARVWRNGEDSRTHQPEFSMLEWYRPHASLEDLMEETEAFVKALLPPVILREGREIPVSCPFERLTMAGAFRKYAGADLPGASGDARLLARQAGMDLRPDEGWEDLFFRILLEKIEPRIGRDRPTFLTHWPARQAALARKNPQDPREALRFELYIGGIELANAFEELTDAREQAARFKADRARRLALSPDQDWEMDQDFLADLAHMPPASGIALGFDRLAMLACNAPEIRDVQWLPLARAEGHN